MDEEVVAWRILYNNSYTIWQQKPTYWTEKYPELVEELIVKKPLSNLNPKLEETFNG